MAQRLVNGQSKRVNGFLFFSHGSAGAAGLLWTAVDPVSTALAPASAAERVVRAISSETGAASQQAIQNLHLTHLNRLPSVNAAIPRQLNRKRHANSEGLTHPGREPLNSHLTARLLDLGGL